MVKVTQMGCCQMAVRPLLGWTGSCVACGSLWGKEEEERGSEGQRVPCCLSPTPGGCASSPGENAASSYLFSSSLAHPLTY